MISTTRLRVALLNTTGRIGGAERALLDLVAAMAGADAPVSYHALLGEPGPMADALSALGVAVEVLPLPGAVARLGDAGLSARRGGALALAAGAAVAAPRGLLYLRNLAARLRAIGPDVVHSNGLKAHALAAWAAARGTPVLWHLHDYLGPRPAMSRLLRRCRRPGLGVVAVSRSVAEDARRVLGPHVPVSSIHNGIDIQRFRREPAPRQGLDVGLVATFAAWKGHGVFLDAAAMVPASLGCRFHVVGGPIYRTSGSQVDPDALRRRAEAHGPEVRFAGHLDDPAAAICGLDIVVHASTRPEPFGLVLAEAMAAGRAIVSTGLGGAAEVVEGGLTALIVPPNDPPALAAAIARLAADAGLRRRLGDAARDASGRFDRGHLVAPWLAAYRGDALP